MRFFGLLYPKENFWGLSRANHISQLWSLDRRPITSLNYLGTDDNEALKKMLSTLSAWTRSTHLLHKRAKIIITGPWSMVTNRFLEPLLRLFSTTYKVQTCPIQPKLFCWDKARYARFLVQNWCRFRGCWSKCLAAFSYSCKTFLSYPIKYSRLLRIASSCCWGFSLRNFLVLTLTHVLNICMKKRDLSDIFWLSARNTPITHLSSENHTTFQPCEPQNQRESRTWF